MRRSLPIALLLALVAWAALACSPASAAEVAHAPEGSFNGSDAPRGPFQYVFGVELDASGGPGDGDVWVAEFREGATPEQFSSSVSRFDEDGHYAGVSLDGSDTPEGSFGFVRFEEPTIIAFDGLAVDGSAGPNKGDLYVTDPLHGVVHRFDEAGQYECQVTGRAAPSASECGGLAGSAVPDGSISPGGLAVDATSGALYVADADDGVIYKFDQAGQLVGQIADEHIEKPGGLAIDSTGALYVVNGSLFEGVSVAKFDASGSFVALVAEEGTIGVGVDPVTDHVYVARPGEVVEYDAAGSELSSFPTEEFSIYPSLVVAEATGRLYAAHFGFEGSGVDLYSPITTVPDVSVGPVTAATETSATLSGEVDPAGAGDVVSCRFEYGTGGQFQHSAPCTPAPTYSSPTAVSADLTGLTPSTDYEFRLAAANGGVAPYTRGVPGHSEALPLVTLGPPTVEEESESGIERTAATLHAKINPRGFESEFRFEYVDHAHFEAEGFGGPATKSTPFSQIGDGSHPLSVAQGIGGLDLGTTYHYRAVARNSQGEGVGAGRQFTTRPVATIDRQWAYARIWEATLEAAIDPIGFETSCHVEYVDDAEFQLNGYAQAEVLLCSADLPAAAKPATGRVQLSGLEIDTKYHFGFVATNAAGTVVGADATFSTFGIDEFSIKLVDEEGNPYTQAGGHPYEKIIRYHFNHTVVPTSGGGSAGSLNAFLKTLITEEPAGETVASLESTPECPGHLAEEERCPDDTHVGEVTVEYLDGGEVSTTTKGIYNVTPPEGIANRYATVDPYLASDSEIRTGGDYGITVGNFNISEEARIVGVTSRIWGIPADHNGGGAERSVTLRNPTTCDGSRSARVRASSWQAPDVFASATTELEPVTGCDKLEFHPSIEWRPTSRVADAPTGLHVNIHQDQHGDPDGIDFADLKNVLIQPLDGVLLNPSGANGLVGCSPAEMGLRESAPARCPDASKVGTVRIVTPLTDHPLDGSIHIATPRDNPFGSLFAIYLAVHDPETGVVVKLAGEIATDAGDGQLTAGFADNPQLPVEDFELDFFDGPRAVLRTPPFCGTFRTESTVTPWSAPHSGPPAHPTDSYEISATPDSGPCFHSEAGAPHRPEFRAGASSAAAGAYAPFVVRLRREDGTQRIARLSVTPPPGLMARIAGIDRCEDTALAAANGRSGVAERARPSCPDGSRVGTAVVAAGAGTDPYYVEGGVFLAGPYRGAPISLAVVVPAVAGPFDLGTVVVRTPLRLDLESGEIEVESDAIPTVLEGVSLDVRTIAIKLDRRGFTVNPTSCEPAATELGVSSPAGQSLRMSEPFQLVRCSRLGFEPKVGMRLLGETERGGHPALRTVLRMPRGGANIARVSVTMPPTSFLDNSHIRGICTRPQFAAGTCAPGTVYGQARAWSPLLSEPLGGPVFMRSSARRLPSLVAELNGEVRLAVVSHIGTSRGGIRVKVDELPDAPVRKFVMQMQGGERGLLQNSVDVCEEPQRARIELEAQNGKVAVLHPLLRARC